MSESETASTKAAIEALKALEADASALERIEKLLDRFNIFETIGFISDELMHSNFLALFSEPRRKAVLRNSAHRREAGTMQPGPIEGTYKWAMLR